MWLEASCHLVHRWPLTLVRTVQEVPLFYDHSRFQAFCQHCFQVFEEDSAVDAIRLVEAHERKQHAVADPSEELRARVK